jgi:hypothetical protein
MDMFLLAFMFDELIKFIVILAECVISIDDSESGVIPMKFAYHFMFIHDIFSE